MLRSILSILAGVVTWGVLSQIFYAVLMAAMPESFGEDNFPRSSGILLALLVLSVVYSLASACVTTGIARDKKMQHVLGLAVLNLLIGIFVQTMSWDKMPLWYHLPFLALVVPAHLLGGKLFLARKLKTAPA